jgi:hypothetical protein
MVGHVSRLNVFYNHQHRLLLILGGLCVSAFFNLRNAREAQAGEEAD